MFITMFRADRDVVRKRRGMKVESNNCPLLDLHSIYSIILIKQYNSGLAPAKCQAC